MRILVVEDEKRLANFIKNGLEEQTYSVDVAYDGKEGEYLALTNDYDILILDILLPKQDGWQTCENIRNAGLDLPIIMLTAKSQVQDKVAGFGAGANDYVTKPVMPAELIARIKAQLSTVQATTSATSTTVRASARIISFVGAKGGVGTTSLIVNLGIVLQNSGKQVALVDFQSANGTICQQTGYASNNNLFSLLKDAAPITPDALGRAMITHKSGLTLLPPPHGVYARYQPVSHKQADSILDIIEGGSDYVLVDLGAILNQTTTSVLKRSHLSCIVSEPNIIAMDLTRRALQYFNDVGIPSNKVGSVLINRSRTGHGFTMAQLKKLLNTEVWGIISPAPELSHQTVQSKKPLVELQPHHLVSQQIQNLIPIFSKV